MVRTPIAPWRHPSHPPQSVTVCTSLAWSVTDRNPTYVCRCACEHQTPRQRAWSCHLAREASCLPDCMTQRAAGAGALFVGPDTMEGVVVWGVAACDVGCHCVVWGVAACVVWGVTVWCGRAVSIVVGGLEQAVHVVFHCPWVHCGWVRVHRAGTNWGGVLTCMCMVCTSMFMFCTC
jgi:hypothetical protein